MPEYMCPCLALEKERNLLKRLKNHEPFCYFTHRWLVIRAIFSFNLSRNIVALQVEKRCCPYYHRVLNFPLNKFLCCKLNNCVAKRRARVYFAQHIAANATLKFIAWEVEHAVVIRATTRSTCNATMLRHKLNENVASITWPYTCLEYNCTCSNHRTFMLSICGKEKPSGLAMFVRININ